MRLTAAPGDLALEACRLLTEWAADHRDPIPDGLDVILGAAEAALRELTTKHTKHTKGEKCQRTTQARC
jgi:hypothetical protein